MLLGGPIAATLTEHFKHHKCGYRLALGYCEGYVEVMVFRLNRRVVVLLTVFFFALGGVLHGFAAAAMTAEMPTMAAAGGFG